VPKFLPVPKNKIAMLLQLYRPPTPEDREKLDKVAERFSCPRFSEYLGAIPMNAFQDEEPARDCLYLAVIERKDAGTFETFHNEIFLRTYTQGLVKLLRRELVVSEEAAKSV